MSLLEVQASLVHSVDSASIQMLLLELEGASLCWWEPAWDRICGMVKADTGQHSAFPNAAKPRVSGGIFSQLFPRGNRAVLSLKLCGIQYLEPSRWSYVWPLGKLAGGLAVFTSTPHIQVILASGRSLDGYSIVQVAVEPLWVPFKAGLWNLCGEGEKNLPTLKWKPLRWPEKKAVTFLEACCPATALSIPGLFPT